LASNNSHNDDQKQHLLHLPIHSNTLQQQQLDFQQRLLTAMAAAAQAQEIGSEKQQQQGKTDSGRIGSDGVNSNVNNESSGSSGPLSRASSVISLGSSLNAVHNLPGAYPHKVGCF
jgi:hypothetical protein